MNLRQMTAWGPSHPSGENPASLPNLERVLTLVVEGTALGVPEVDATAYQLFRASVSQIALQLSHRMPGEEKLAQIRTILNEFQNYRKNAEEEIRNRTSEWRSLASFLFNDLLNSLGIEPSSAKADELLRKISAASAAARVEALRRSFEAFLHPGGDGSAPDEASRFHAADHSTANNNASGLPGGGSAIERLRQIVDGGGKGFIALFRLSCLNMINQRFGAEAVEDCLMAVAAVITQSLNADDAIYHWSDSSLLAILQGRNNEQIAIAELERIVFQNRETSVNIGGRATMLRIPLTFELVPIDRLQSADDLYKITLLSRSRSAR